MRTPNHLEIKKLCEKSIPALMQKYDLGEIRTLVMDQNGWVNPCFFVNDRFVFRFNARDVALPKFQRENLVFNLLADSEIPVPRVVGFDESKTVAPFDVLLTEMLPGKNLEAEWSHLDLNDRMQLAEQAGSCLADLHSVSFDFFGELAGQGPLPQTETWFEYLEAKLKLHLSEALKLEIFDQDLVARTWKLLRSSAEVLSAVTSPRLLHLDYHFGNLLYSDKKITGVLDFEWALAGDPLFDLDRWRSEKEEWPDSRVSFLKGYGQKEFTAAEIQRMDIYQMIHNIELAIVAKLHFSAEEARDYRQTTVQQILRLENKNALQKIKLRASTDIADIENVMKIVATFGASEENLTKIKEYISQEFLELGERRILYLLEDDRDTVGMAQLILKRSEEEENSGDEVAHIHGLQISKNLHRKGHASLLLRQLENAAKDLGLKRLTLAVDGDNDKAIQLYHKAGYLLTKARERKNLGIRLYYMQKYLN